MAEAHVDVEVGGEGFEAAGDERVQVGDGAAHEIRDAAGRIRAVPAPVEGHDGEVVESSAAPGLRRSAHPGRVGADDHEAFAHVGVTGRRVAPGLVGGSGRFTSISDGSSAMVATASRTRRARSGAGTLSSLT